MFEKILLPLDGSEVAETALPYGEELARGLGAELVLVHVRAQDRQPDYSHIHEMYLERLADTVRRNVSKAGKTARVTTEVASGEPTETICGLAEKTNASLVIMVSVSASGLRIGKPLGSVADQVCRTVPVPVMLIRPQHIEKNKGKEQLINQILLPLDGSELSKLALPVGEELADKLKVRITIFRMATSIIPFVSDMAGAASIDYSKFDKAEEDRVRVEMNSLEQELAGKGLNVSNVVVTGYDAAFEIIETCKKVNADLVVMSTHGRSGLGRWVFGNVAERVLRHGETPLLLVHAKAA